MTAPTTEQVGQDIPVRGGNNDEDASRLSFLDDLVEIVMAASPETLGRAVFAVSALHTPDDTGRCRMCRDCRPWQMSMRRRRCVSVRCPTLLVLRFTLAAESAMREVGR